MPRWPNVEEVESIRATRAMSRRRRESTATEIVIDRLLALCDRQRELLVSWSRSDHYHLPPPDMETEAFLGDRYN